MARILVVEDEPGLARALSLGLRDEGHVVRVERDGQEGPFAALSGEHDLLLLLRTLPRFSGDEIFRRQLAGIEVRDEDTVLLSEGTLRDRTWSGALAIESEDGPEEVWIAVSQDVS